MSSSPSVIWIWTQAARPKTLWAAVAPVLVGSALAWRDGVFHWPSALAALLGGILLQIAANFANDLFDFERGADTHERLGPLRVTHAGLVSPRAMRTALFIVIAIAFAIGIYLVWRGGWPIVAIGLCSIVALILYTGGPFPYGYRGLGELFVFIFFGGAAVGGTYWVQALAITPTAIWVSASMGCLAVAILVVNNLRDIDTDRAAGKRTLAVMLGRTGARVEYVVVLIVAACVPVALVLLHLGTAWVMLATAGTLLAVPMIRTAFRATDGPTLNGVLAQTARLQLLYGILLSIGLNL